MRDQTYYEELTPCAALKPYIIKYFYIRTNSNTLHIPADGCPGLILSIGDPFSLGFESDNLQVFSGCHLFGSFTRQLLTKNTGQTELIAVKFLPGQLTRFFRIRALELTDTSTSIQSLWGKFGRELEQKLYEADTVPEKIGLLELAFLARVSSQKQKYDNRILIALQAISSRKGQVNIQGLADYLELSKRHLERRFIDLIGLTPKRLCRITRFISVFSQVRACKGLDWADLAISCGYSDQAHLIRECKFFTGQSPLSYLKNRSSFEHAVMGTDDMMSPFFNTADVSPVTMPQKTKLWSIVDKEEANENFVRTRQST